MFDKLSENALSNICVGLAVGAGIISMVGSIAGQQSESKKLERLVNEAVERKLLEK